MHAWESIQKTLNYIEEHIGHDISIDELAKLAALSPFYYQRLFSRLVKKPVAEYIKLRRLARSCDMLLDRKKLIAEVAFQFGFKNHETFTRTFKEIYGITPTEYRSNSITLKHFDNPDLMLSNVVADEGVPLISDGLVLEMNIKTLKNKIDFLGGSVEEGETLIDALKREVLEESGLIVKDNSIVEFGEVTEIKADKFENNTIYIAHNYYFHCDVEKGLSSTSMTEHELQMGCHLVWEEIDRIISSNDNLEIKEEIFRDNRVFKLLL